MATIVERPMSALNDIQANMERNTRRNSIEVIDVDEFDDTTQRAASLSRSPPRPRPRMRTSFHQHPETIVLSDSDDDEIEILPQTHRPIRPLPQNRRRLRSPPPPPIVLVPPPVPRLPRSLATFASLPLRRQLHSIPPVRPSAEPPAFQPGYMARTGTPTQPEAGPSNLFNPRPPRRNPAAPPSHHTPAMGFGGALISSNNARAVQEAVQAARSAHTRVISAYRRRNQHHPDGPGFLLHNPEEDDMPHIRRWMDSPQDAFLRLADRLRGRESASSAKYQKSYTHPDAPEPGFTFDFALPSPEDDGPHAKFFPPTSANAPIIIDDDDVNPGLSRASLQDSSASSGESSSLTTLLVCARCLDPLPLNETLGPEDQGKRVWALRCGHMIDQKCLNEIGKPEDDPELMTPVDPIDKKGKGKTKAKQNAVESEDILMRPTASIRSRLRSAASTSSSPSTPAPQIPSKPPAKKRRITAVVPTIEAEFEWKCPVASCSRQHASTKIDGVWGPEKEGKPLTGVNAFVNGIMDWNAKAQPRGAIPVFA